MEKSLSLIAFFCILVVFQDRLVAQQQSSRNIFAKASADHLQLLRDHAAIYNGAEYVGYGQQINGHPFFGDDNQKRGDLLYLGVWYKDVPLYYDLVAGIVLIQRHDGFQYIRLASGKIGAFTYDSSYFVRISPPLNNETEPAFFQQLYDGRIKIYAQKKKVIVASGSSEKGGSFFQQFNQYYVVNNKQWFEIKSRRDLLTAYRRYKDPIRRWLSDQPYRFKKNPEWILLKSAAFIETLSNR
jgi:hypothetical protein